MRLHNPPHCFAKSPAWLVETCHWRVSSASVAELCGVLPPVAGTRQATSPHPHPSRQHKKTGSQAATARDPGK